MELAKKRCMIYERKCDLPFAFISTISARWDKCVCRSCERNSINCSSDSIAGAPHRARPWNREQRTTLNSPAGVHTWRARILIALIYRSEQNELWIRIRFACLVVLSTSANNELDDFKLMHETYGTNHILRTQFSKWKEEEKEKEEEEDEKEASTTPLWLLASMGFTWTWINRILWNTSSLLRKYAALNDVANKREGGRRERVKQERKKHKSKYKHQLKHTP